MSSAISIAPNIAEDYFLYCMLKERTGEGSTEIKACYEKVVTLISQDKPGSCKENINCIIADLMAEGPQAKARKREFLAQPVKSTEAEIGHYLLDGFNRKSFLRSILP